MKRVLAIGVVLIAVGMLSLPEIVMTQGAVGRVLNTRLRRVYAMLGNPGEPGSAFADAALAPGDRLLIAGDLNEPATGVFPPAGWRGAIVSQTPAALAATVRITGGVCPATVAVIDLTPRGGLVQWVGGNVVIPNFCFGFLSDTNTLPLTISNVRMSLSDPGNSFVGIDLVDESGGPFNILNNTITGGSGAYIGIDVDGIGAATTLTIRGNRITDAAAGGAHISIDLSGLLPGPILIERNTVIGDPTVGAIGIFLDDVKQATVRKNTVRDFATGAIGIDLSDVDGTQVRLNRLQNNFVGIDIAGANYDEGFPALAVRDNNILGTPATQFGLFFTDAGGNLDAALNFWGAASGPSSGSMTANTCPEATGASCLTLQPGATDGTGMPIVTGGGPPECGSLAGQVTTCPHRTIAVIGAGA
jgi:hypothetical protein